MTVEFMNIPCLQTLYIVEMWQNKSEHGAVLSSAQVIPNFKSTRSKVIQRQIKGSGQACTCTDYLHISCALRMAMIWCEAFVGAEEITLDAPKSALSLRTGGTCWKVVSKDVCSQSWHNRSRGRRSPYKIFLSQVNAGSTKVWVYVPVPLYHTHSNLAPANPASMQHSPL